MIVKSDATITLIGGASLDDKLLARARHLGSEVVAADGGADAALARGILPRAVIGDFDSISPRSVAALPQDRLHRIPEQESTDFDKCLRNIEAPLVIGVGFSGDRLDHQLACYNALVRHPSRVCVVLGREELVFLCPPSLRLDLPEHTPASLFPMGAVEGVSNGLLWPIGGVNFAPDGPIGTSNTATGPVDLSLTSPKMLMILPEYTLETVAAALLANPSRWE